MAKRGVKDGQKHGPHRANMKGEAVCLLGEALSDIQAELGLEDWRQHRPEPKQESES